MKKLLLLFSIMPFLAFAQVVPADASQFENIQMTNNATSSAAAKVVVQEANGVLNTIAKTGLIEVIEVASASALPVTGAAGKIYVTLDNQIQYRWTGSIYNAFGQLKANLNSPTFTGSVVVPAATLSTQAVNKSQLDQTTTARLSGLAEGGEMSINAVNSKYNVTAGFGYIINGHSDLNNQTSTKVTWTAKLANLLPAIATQKQTYVALDINGDLFLTASPLTATQRRNYIRLGVIGHFDNSTITEITNQPTVNIELGGQVQDILEALGFRSLSGNRIFPVASNLKIKKEVGRVFKAGANYSTLLTQPHSFTLAAQDPITFKYRTQTGAEGADLTDITPAIYDLNGTITAVASTATLATIQRIYIFQDGIVRIQPGQRVFTTLNAAVTAINSDVFVSDLDISDNALYLGAIVLTRNTVDLSNIAQAIFVPSSGTTANGSTPAPPLGFTPENVVNKQNSLDVDGTGAKYGTVDAINAGLDTRAPLSGSASYIQNQNATAQVANSKINGSQTAGSFVTADDRKITITNGVVNIKGDAGGWDLKTSFTGSASANLGGFGALGSANALSYYYVGVSSATPLFKILPSGASSFSDLEGTGTRTIRATASGALTTAKTVLSFSGAANQQRPLLPSETGALIICTGTSVNSILLNADYAIGEFVEVVSDRVSLIFFTPGSNVIIKSRNSFKGVIQNGLVRATYIAANNWLLTGDLQTEIQ